MATEVTKHDYSFNLFLSFHCVSVCSVSQSQPERLMDERTALIHCELFGMREGFCKWDANKQSSISL